MARAGSTRIKDNGRGEGIGCAGQARRKRILPERSSTTLSGMPSPLKSARNGVSGHRRRRGQGRLKVAVTAPQEHTDRAVVVAHDDQVGPAVAVDVGDDRLDRRTVGGEGLLSAKGPVTIVQEDAHAVAAVVGHDDAGLAVAGQVGDGHPDRAESRRRTDAGNETSRRPGP